MTLDTVRQARDAGSVSEAIAEMRDQAPDEVREVILERYHKLAADGPRLDRGAPMRAALIRGLRGLSRPVDAALAESATYVYERSATSKWDVAGNLRGAALLLLAELDAPLALFQAARLLVDPQTPEMSAEPAITAARLLRSHDQLLPLYMFLSSGASPHGELVGECLLAMTGAPENIARGLVELYRDADNDAARAGLFDMLLERRDEDWARSELETLLRAGPPDPVYAYVAASIVAGRAMELVAVMQEVAGASQGLRKRMLGEALSLFPNRG